MYLYNTQFSALAYPLLVWLLCVWFSLFVMIINLLIWANTRNTCRQQGNGDSAA